MALLLVFVLALGAGILGGGVGTGSPLIMLPALMARYGPRTAAPSASIDAMRKHKPRYTLRPIRFEERACRLCW